jgi:hypothetical protein
VTGIRSTTLGDPTMKDRSVATVDTSKNRAVGVI